MKAFIVYATYEIVNNEALVLLFGRLENGESFMTRNKFRPYFFIKTSDRKKAEKEFKVEYEDSDFKDFDDEPLTKVIIDSPQDIVKLRDALQKENIICYEADVRFTQRFLIDHDLKGSCIITGEHTKGEYTDRIYENPSFSPTFWFPKLRVLSMDIETDRKAREIWSISLAGEEIKEVLIVKDDGKKYKHAICFKNEEELLRAFKEKIKEYDPDLIVGWNVIDFDWKALKGKFDEYQIDFMFGRMNRPSTLRLEKSFFVDSSAHFHGRQVLDGIHLLKTSFVKLPDYKLNTAAKHFLKKEKIFTGSDRWEEIEKAYKKNPQLMIDYNLLDSELVLDILKESKVLDLTIQRSLLTRMTLDRVNASIATLDSLYLKELQKRKLVAPTAYVQDRDERIKGGFVLSSKPGIYENILVCDFKSLYPSIMRTFNIDPASFISHEKAIKKKIETKNLIEAPNGAYFKNEEGILPMLIHDLWKQRDAAKKNKDLLTSHAIKITMNSFFGVLANPACRFYSIELANAITHFGQFLIKLSAKNIGNKGYDVIYGDTDSLFVDVHEKDIAKAEKIGREIEKYINEFYQGYIEQEYKRKSFLELEFEKVYKKFLMPKIRHSEEGAKKRYAGILVKDGKEVMDFVGLEFVRRDWTELAKKFQLELLERIFKEKPVEEYVKNFVEDLKKGKYDQLLVYRKAIRKPVSSYTKTTPPHIKAAKKIGRDEVGIIDYYMTLQGPEEINHSKSKIDYEHYIAKQIKPLADSILCFYNTDFDSLTQLHKQKSLGDY